MSCGYKHKNKRVKNTKVITVYINGHRTESYKIVLDSKRYKTWHSVLNQITNKVNPNFGFVKKLYSAESGITICSISDIEDNGTYVASNNQRFQIIKGGYNNNIIRNYYEHYLTGQLERSNKTKKLSHVRWDLLVIYIFTNGKENKLPAKFVLSREDLQNWEQTLSFIALILDEQYRSIKSLYNANGHKICGPWELQHGASYIAVGYHEKFIPRNYKIKEYITEMWKNELTFDSAQRKERCLHHNNTPKSWKQTLQWKHAFEDFYDYSHLKTCNLKPIMIENNLRRLAQQCTYPSSQKINTSSTSIIPSDKYGCIHTCKLNSKTELFNPYKKKRNQ